MNVKPEPEHQWLKRIVGEWTYEGEAVMVPGQPPAKWSGTESVRAVGDVWVIGEGRGEMPGSADWGKTVITLGYDPQKKRIIGTFLGSMMTYMWVYEGTLDPERNVLTLDTMGPSGHEGDAKLAKFQDTVELLNDDHRVLTSSMQNEDGTWSQFMTAHYRRKK